MKSKKIILGMISTLILLAVFVGQNVLAVEQLNPTLKLTEVCADSFPSVINEQNPEFAMQSNNFRITQIGDENGNRKSNMYCAKEGVGFESRNINPETHATENNVANPYIDTYEYKYNMSTPANDGEKTAIQGMYSKYNEILALADLFYLDNSEKSLQDYLNEIYSRENFDFEVSFNSLVNYQEGSALITLEQLKAVQQAALWYFTNYDNATIRAWLLSDDEINNTAVNFLYYRTGLTTTIGGDKYVSLGGRPVNEDENHITIQDDNLRKDLQDWQAKKLFKYFVETAISNAENTNYVNQNTVYLYLKKTIEGENLATYKEKSQPVIEIVPGKKEFDLALRKYITKIDNTEITNRIPNVVTEGTLDADDTTASYKHRKDPVVVQKGSFITYTITVYNEGDFAGKATKIIDQLPKGVEFKQTETEAIAGNANYTFEYDEAANKVTIKAKDSLENLEAYKGNGELDSTSVDVVVKVTEAPDTDNDKILTNIAYISEEYNASNNKTYSGDEKVFDRDSAPGTYPNKTANELISNNPNDYKGKTSNKDVEPADSDYFYKGEEDEDDFEKIVIKPEKMDLALRKFITKVGNKDITDRIPTITGNAIEGENTTAEKKHSKEAVAISKGEKVVYTIRVYNEGTVDGYAKEVTDYLPEGLDLAQNSSINETYGWTAEGKTIKTSYLADKMLKAVNRDYSKFNAEDAEEQGYYRDLKIECVVNDNATYNKETKKSNLKNIAEITEAEDKNGNKKDEDSTPKNIDKDNYNPTNPENGKGVEDDDDFEDLKLPEFDLALRKYVTKVGNTDLTNRLPNIETKETLDKGEDTASYKHRKDPVVVKNGSLVTYTITVYNEGEIAGKATKIVDQLPKGVEFRKAETEAIAENANYTFEYDEAANKVTIKAKDSLGNLEAYNGTLDSTSVKVVVKVTETPDTDNYKILTNIAYISEAYNAGADKTYSGEEKGFDRDSAPGTHPNKTANELISNNPNDYKGKTSNKDVTPADSNFHYEGYEDDDDFEKIAIKPEKMDLALRKFITKVGNKDITDRIPTITGNAIEGEDTTAEKKHSKEPVAVAKGEKVVYTIRVYNEGTVDGYAKEVTDYLPEGLTLAENSSINETYGWTADGKTIKTSYLADKMLKAVNGDYSKFNAEDAEEQGYYRDLKIECVVNDNVTKKSNLKNIAEITKQEDKNGNDKDEDSTPKNTDKDNYNPTNPENGKGEEDDDDFEDLKLQEFDLALRKYIAKVEDKDGKVVQSNENLEGRTPNIDTSTIESKTTTATYKHQKDPVVVKTGDYIYYNLTVYNEGDIEGYASKITDQLPAGIEFVEVVPEKDKQYYEKESYDAKTNTLVLKCTDKIYKLSPYTKGEDLDSVTVTIKCKVVATGEDKIYTNIAWISEDHNDKNVTDRDSNPTKHPSEDKLVTDYNDKGYIGDKEANKDKDLANKDEYFQGEEDDEDFEKVIIYKVPEIHKGVKDVKNQDSGYDADVKHEWVINSTLPLNIANYTKYVITDDIDYRLVFDKVASVKIIDKDGKTVAELKENEDYVLEYTENKSNDTSDILGNKYSGTLKLRFIDAEKSVSNKLKANGGNIIEVKFTTTFATDKDGNVLAEIIGKQIPNKAKLEYDNGSGDKGEDKSEQPEVHTGGITLYKYTTVNGKKVALKDAEFEIFRNKEDATTRQNEVKNGKTKSSVKALQTATSGKDGLVKFVGLEYGEDAMDNKDNKKADGTYIQGTDAKRVIPSTTYWIVETKAPKGYKTITDVIEVSINNDTYKDEVEVLIKEEESKEKSSRLIENQPLNFDLALRKFITKINDKNITTRIPEVKYENGKISYNHTKEPEDVVNGDVVTYTLRVFNEGQINGYAEIVTDDIPEGLEFLPEHNTNKQYRWVMYAELKDGEKVEDESKVIECQVNGSSEVKKYVETTDAKKAVIIRTDYLSKEQGEKRMEKTDTENPNLLKAFDSTKKISETNPDNRDVLAAFRVVEPNGSKRTLINYAQISKHADENGDEITDIDSTPDKWNEGEDDQDIEKIRVPEFDLALRKWVTQAIVIENGKQTVTNTGHDAWDDPEGIVKVELHRKKLSNVTVKFKYSIRVYNQGEIDGYAKEITDYVPQGLKFVAADNPGWKDEGNNVISTRLLENKLLKAKTGYADVEVILTWINGTDNLGLKTNIAEISEDYNEKGVPDKDSTPDNRKPGEDDIDDAPVMLSVSTGTEVTYIVLGLSILAVIAGGVILIKKYVL